VNIESQATCDAEGYLIDPEQWDESVACLRAADEGIEPEPDYWPIP
jgi:sulfur relay (sulfurtransferase) DsrC/TusE family protein